MNSRSYKSCCKLHFKERVRTRLESITCDDIYQEVRLMMRRHMKGHKDYNVFPIGGNRFKIILKNICYIVVFNEKLKQLVTIWPDIAC
jgi:hypothetical protein